ncbi:hypothetical protein NXX78_21690 [Bacteroides fragilis]|nr:hypothetical protein [Bacteroides fragilis]
MQLVVPELHNSYAAGWVTRRTDVPKEWNLPWQEGIIKVRTFAGADLRLYKPRSPWGGDGSFTENNRIDCLP